MTPDRYVLDRHPTVPGGLAVRYETILSDEPVRKVLWWPIVARASHYSTERADALLGRDLRPTGDGYTTAGWTFRVDGGAPACRVERQPVPPPRTRCATRWYLGEWQKATRRGWVRA